MLVCLAGCTRPGKPIPVDPDVNFAAHLAHDKIVLDRAPGGVHGQIRSQGWSLATVRRFEVISTQDERLAELLLTAPATVTARTVAGDATGGIDPAWEDGAIRLSVRAGAAVFRTDLFQRMTGGGPPALSRIAQTVIEVRGTFRAALRDANGADVGWLRVKVTPYADAARIYDGVVPTEMGPGVTAAIALALDSEVEWIETHTVDVYRGTNGGPLRESIPLGR
jgi:hypothetical protein